jgi:hypothetical protein
MRERLKAVNKHVKLVKVSLHMKLEQKRRLTQPKPRGRQHPAIKRSHDQANKTSTSDEQTEILKL